NSPDGIIDTRNSGTALSFGLAVAALGNEWTVLTGDSQVSARPLAPLIAALDNLGGHVFSANSNGKPPVAVKGRIKGGRTEIDAMTSQFLSALLIAAPLLEHDTIIDVTRISETPYVEMTLEWLGKQRIKIKRDGLTHYEIKGNQKYKPFKANITGDFSSAAYFAVLAAMTKNEITLENVDFKDSQGDKLIFDVIRSMGADVDIQADTVTVKGDTLKGMVIDMNSFPDALPAMAVAGCFAEGETRLVNVAQARMKDTDRISAMCSELKKMGADISESEDGLVIRQSKLYGCRVEGHNDDRVVMALAIAGLSIDGITSISTAEAVKTTFPQFIEILQACGGTILLQ
ncbi:MAG: 3-phosphoshikimate 1-carboxyvinyltransferase, partial [Eubacteriales bacterium]|nr:3-phosphoshikimate 1-carboxyvinyltransferase [Eubacteriales bacterium]